MDEKLNNELEALINELIEFKNKSPINEDDIRLQLYENAISLENTTRH